jgi:hypothetical protein
MPDTTITESELLATEAARRKAFESLVKEVQADTIAVIERYRELMIKYVDKKDLDQLLKFITNTADEYANEIARPVVSSFTDITTIENDFFKSIPVIEDAAAIISSIDKAAVYKVFLDDMEKGFLEMSYEHRDTLRRVIRKQIADGIDLGKLYDAFDQSESTLKTHAVTLARTTSQGVAQAYTNLAGKNAGCDYGWYTGTFTATTRLFCEQRLDKVYPISEIEKMDNEQGLPVLTYCGGYNCLHRIVRVNPKWGQWIKEKMV